MSTIVAGVAQHGDDPVVVGDHDADRRMGVGGDLDAVAPGGLRRVERLVGAGEERLGVAALGGPGDADADRDVAAGPVGEGEVLDDRAQALAGERRALERLTGRGDSPRVIGRPARPLGTALDVCPCDGPRARPITALASTPPRSSTTRLPELRADYGDVAVQLLELFERTAAETLGELHTALAAGDREEVRRLAHRRKGSARNVGATGMADLSAALRAAGARPLEAAFAPTCAALRAALDA